MRTASAISTGLHAAVLLWALVSFTGKTFEVTPAESLPVDLINDKDFSELTKGTKDAPKVEQPKPLAEKKGDPKPAEEVTPKISEKKEIQAVKEKTSEPQPQTKPDSDCRQAQEAGRSETGSQSRAQAAAEKTATETTAQIRCRQDRGVCSTSATHNAMLPPLLTSIRRRRKASPPEMPPDFRRPKSTRYAPG